jgi:hypothetical protein
LLGLRLRRSKSIVGGSSRLTNLGAGLPALIYTCVFVPDATSRLRVWTGIHSSTGMNWIARIYRDWDGFGMDVRGESDEERKGA